MQINITQAGSYQVTATDGYCSVTDTIQISDVNDLFPPPVLAALPDTALCPEFFPYTLLPRSPYTSEFNFEGRSFTDSLSFTQAGLYSISAALAGCTFTETFRLEQADCAAQIYLPNAFSPNDDGINDDLFPQGSNFASIRLQVFDRWGGLVHQSEGSNARWDGKRQGKPAATGAYVLVLRYFNTRNLREEVLVRELVLVR